MKVGILELLLDRITLTPTDKLVGRMFRRQLYSIMPQTIAVWCRELGQHGHYATYYGQRDPTQLLPNDLDVVFVAAYTQASALAYAIAKRYRMDGVLTVIGGPHAKAFPEDCQRFFDIVVGDCDKTLLDDILSGRIEPPASVSSDRPPTDLASVEERQPEISASALKRGRASRLSVISLLASTGCPYSCDFCTDWNSRYHAVPTDRLAADLRYISVTFPGALVAFHDPNFAVRFDETMDVLEAVSDERRNAYVMESSLSILKRSRLERLRRTRCLFIASGLESWTDYGAKAGTGSLQGLAKLERVVEQFRAMRDYVPGLQANLLFGTDLDRGSEPAELTNEFMRRLPYVWPGINIPTPYGGTPLYHRYLSEGRILEPMPISLYFAPYLATTLKHYDPLEYYDHLIGIYEVMTSRVMLLDRLRARAPFPVRLAHLLRTLAMRQELAQQRRVRTLLATDRGFRAFHEGRRAVLPEFYHRVYERRLGRYANLISRRERTPSPRLQAREEASTAMAMAS